MTFRRKPAAAPVDLIILGLGNPGREYTGTRHNLGFMCLDEVARRLGVRVSERNSQSLVGTARRPGDGGSILLAKPQTFMNLSGRAAAALVRKHKLQPSDVWVIHDEMDIPFGKLRIRKGGGSGGNNGVRSLIADLGDSDFARFRMGVGRPEPEDAVDYLLSPFTEAERARLPEFVGVAADAVLEALAEGIDISMNRHNGQSV
ncbi:MAG TPA: aminoacyl-tRNA hydrolase [Candidatus Solibacter sp.]|jgi:PTH1 family peptidyl-tRNA hydrolase|nr:aminoacyl-tRNA hydrolase [Candidatus Solibacter sp.]